jgi:hypothetical protein
MTEEQAIEVCDKIVDLIRVLMSYNSEFDDLVKARMALISALTSSGDER